MLKQFILFDNYNNYKYNQSIMGKSFSCFQNIGRKKGQKQSAAKYDKFAIPSVTQLKLWRSQLGVTDTSKLLNFQYPTIIVHHSFKQIEKDIGRTFPDCQFFMKPQNQSKFLKILCDFSVYFPKTGYTQGINFIAGYLLLSGCSERETFTLLSKLSTHHNLMLLGLFEDQFPLNRVYCSLLWQILCDKQADLAQRIKQLNIPDELWIFQWFMTLLIYSFPFYVVRQLLTFMLKHKGMSLVKLVYGIIVEIKPFIQKCNQQIKFLELCQRLKSRQFCQKHIKLDKVIQSASRITDNEIHQYLNQVNIHKNFYLHYFKLEQNNRIIKNVEYMNQLHDQRKMFLASPNSTKFQRNINDISMLDGLESMSYIKLYQSLLSQHQKIDQDILGELQEASTRMWSSDLMHIQVKDFSPTSVKQNQRDILQYPQPPKLSFKKKK